MLKSLQHYTPFKSTFTEWWYGNEDGNDLSDKLPPVTEESSFMDNLTSVDNSNKREVNITDQYSTTPKINIIEENILFSSDDEYKSSNDYSRRNTFDFETLSSINNGNSNNERAILFSSDDEYRTCNEQQSGLVNSQHELDDRVRQLILQDKNNEKSDEGLSSSHAHTPSSLDTLDTLHIFSNSPLESNHLSTSYLSSSAPTMESRRVSVRSIDNTRVCTDSDSSCFDTNRQLRKKQRQRSGSGGLFPFSLFFNNKRKHRRRRAISVCSGGREYDETDFLLIVKPKSYGCSSDREITIQSHQNVIDQIKRYKDSENEGDRVDLNTDMLSASYLSNRHQSESSILLSTSLNSSWSEYTISLPSAYEASECRESDSMSANSMPSSQEMLIDDRTRAKRPENKQLAGHFVNEAFLENECFCCQCSIM